MGQDLLEDVRKNFESIAEDYEKLKSEKLKWEEDRDELDMAKREITCLKREQEKAIRISMERKKLWMTSNNRLKRS